MLCCSMKIYDFYGAFCLLRYIETDEESHLPIEEVGNDSLPTEVCAVSVSYSLALFQKLLLLLNRMPTISQIYNKT